MKTILFMLLFTSLAYADIHKCIYDAPQYGKSLQLLTHTDECSNLIMEHSQSKKVATKDGSISIYALANMIHTVTPQESGLIAGVETRLNWISGIYLSDDEKTLLVYQELEDRGILLQFIVGEIGHVVPSYHLEGAYLKNLSGIKMNAKDQEIELISKDGKTSTFVWSGGDSRLAPDQPELTPRTIRVVQRAE
jgi:hypothetical protein